MLDCLEHIPDTAGVAQKVAAWLRPGGTLMVRRHISNSCLSHLKHAIRRVTGPVKRLPGYPLDANMFNPRSLTTMLDHVGIQAVQWLPDHNFANLLAKRRSTPA
jgi:hypothetical protein